MTPDETIPSGGTVEADRRDAVKAHEADRAPTPAEEAVAERTDLDPAVAEAYDQANKRGAGVQGEGAI